jgi:hypothetical protein
MLITVPFREILPDADATVVKPLGTFGISTDLPSGEGYSDLTLPIPDKRSRSPAAPVVTSFYAMDL